MKNLFVILFVVFSSVVFSQSVEEMKMIIEINKIRKDPKSYIPVVEDYIKKQEIILKLMSNPNVKINTSSYSGNMDSNNDMINVKKISGKDVHIENIKEAKDLISVLDTLTPMDTLVFDPFMYKITVSHGEYLKSVNKSGHFGPNGQTVFERLGRNNVSENCGIGLINLMVDSGIPGHGHRYNILNPKSKYVAIHYIINHPTWGDSFMIQNFME
jgi:hypothetical protein